MSRDLYPYTSSAALDQGGSGAFARKGASTRFRGVDRFSEGVRRAQRTGTWRRSGRPVQLKSGEPRQGRKAATVTDIFRVPPVFVRGVGDSQRVQVVAFEERLRGVFLFPPSGNRAAGSRKQSRGSKPGHHRDPRQHQDIEDDDLDVPGMAPGCLKDLEIAILVAERFPEGG